MKVICHSTEDISFRQLYYKNSSVWQRAGAASLTSNLSSVIMVTELACQHFYHEQMSTRTSSRERLDAGLLLQKVEMGER